MNALLVKNPAHTIAPKTASARSGELTPQLRMASFDSALSFWVAVYSTRLVQVQPRPGDLKSLLL